MLSLGDLFLGMIFAGGMLGILYSRLARIRWGAYFAHEPVHATNDFLLSFGLAIIWPIVFMGAVVERTMRVDAVSLASVKESKDQLKSLLEELKALEEAMEKDGEAPKDEQ